MTQVSLYSFVACRTLVRIEKVSLHPCPNFYKKTDLVESFLPSFGLLTTSSPELEKSTSFDAEKVAELGMLVSSFPA